MYSILHLQRLYLHHESSLLKLILGSICSLVTFPSICFTMCMCFFLKKKSFCKSFSKAIKTFSSTPLSCLSFYFLHQFGNFHPYSSHHATFTAMYPLSLLLHFHHSSPRELIASSFVLAEQQGNNGRVGLVVVATGMRWEEGERDRKGGCEGGRQRRKRVEQAQRGCWLLAGRQGSEHQLITLGSMHTAIKP